MVSRDRAVHPQTLRNVVAPPYWAFRLISASVLLLVAGVAATADAHEGRRFLIEVVNQKMQAQGVNTGVDDGGGYLRPYLNSLHDHWKNSQFGQPNATSLLPEFEVPVSAAFANLESHELRLTLRDAFKWVDPPLMPPSDTIPVFQPLGGDQIISIEKDNQRVSTDNLGGSLILSESVPTFGTGEITTIYTIPSHPVAEIQVLEVVLSATNLNGPTLIQDSDPIFIALSPDGADPIQRLHHASLFLEGYLATLVPEPSSATGLLMLLGLCALFRRHSG